MEVNASLLMEHTSFAATLKIKCLTKQEFAMLLIKELIAYMEKDAILYINNQKNNLVYI
jgi:hypothetical protein